MSIRRAIWLVILLSAGQLAISPELRAKSLLYWTDHVVGEDAMAGALAGIGEFGNFNVTIATGDADFATRVATGNYELGILFVQFDSSGYDSIGALADFANNGGSAMYADFSGNNNNAARFGFQYTGNVNQSEVTLTAPLLRNPVLIEDSAALASPGWVDHSFGLGLHESQGRTLAQFENGDAAAVLAFPGGPVISFGMLNDVFADYEAGVGFFTNAIIAIPEPGTYALFLGLLGLLIAFTVRRTRTTVSR